MTQETSQPPPSTPGARWWKRKRVWVPLLVLIALLAGVGPWPTYSDSYENTPYAEATFRRVEQASFDLRSGPLEVGVGVADITPKLGEPLAGFGGRSPNNADVPIDNLRAEAISLHVDGRTVTIVGGDILLFLPELRQAVLQRVDLREQDVLLTATHTHSGPGGYDPGMIHQFVTGRYDRNITDRLAEAFARAIRDSLDTLQPARVRTRIVTPNDDIARTYCLNRIEPGGRPHGTVALAVFDPVDANDPNAIASLVIASPHPTCHSSSNLHPTGGHPGVVKRALEERLGGRCLFAIGATGSMRASKNAPKGPRRAQDVGRHIVAVLDSAGALDANDARRETTIGSALIEVALPPQQYRISAGLRLTPYFTSLAHGRTSHLHAMRIGQLVLLGMPADYSGELAMALENEFRAGPLRPVVTSFNGDYIGYLVPRARYALDHYETRDMNFFGPWCGEYFNAIARRLLARAARLKTPG